MKNFSFSISDYSAEFSLWKKSYSEKIIAAKKWLFWKRRKKAAALKKIAAPKIKLLCRSSHSEKVWRSSFSKNKVALKKPQHIPEGKSLLEKKLKLDQWLRLSEIIFPERFSHPGKYSYEIPHEYWPELTEEEIIRLCLCHTIFINF